MDEDEIYYKVELQAFAFNTKAEAEAFRTALLDAFCDMPEAEEVAAFSTIVACGDKTEVIS